MNFFARKKMDYPDDEIKQLRRRLAQAEERIKTLEGEAGRARFLEAVVQGVAEPILVIDKNYNIILKNSAADGYWGIQHGMLPKCHEVSHGEGRPCNKKDWPCPLKEVLETGNPITVTHEHRTAHGPRQHEILASPLLGPDGEVEGIIETARDVTERKVAEEALKEAMSKLEFLTNNNPAVLYTAEPGGTWRATFISENIKDILGYEPEEFFEDPSFWADHVHPDDRESVFSLAERVFEDETVRYEYRFRHKNGSWRWMHDEVKLVRDAEGAPVQAIGYWIDVTPRRTAEERLKEEYAFRSAIENSINAGVVILGPDGRITYINPAFSRIVGWSTGDLLGLSPPFPFWPPEHAGEFGERLKARLAGRIPPAPTELVFMRKSGERVNILLSPSVLLDAQGKQVGWLAAVTDITELKQAEQLLRESEERFRSLFENSLDAILLSSQDGHYYAANPAACRMLGYSEEELLRVGRDGITDRSDPNLPKYLADRKNRGRARAELTLVRKDGTRFPAEVSASVFTDREGRQRASIIIRDITRRKRAEEDLKKFKFILDGAGEEFYIFDSSGNFEYVNAGAVKSLGYSEKELLGMSISDIDSHHDRKRIAKLIEESKRGELPAFETVHKAKDGRLIPKEVKAEHLEIGGRDYFFSFVRDVSDRKALERQRNDFLAMVTHDLKSPLTAILGYSQLLRDEGKRLGEGDVESMAEAVNQSGERLLRLVEDFLTISRMEAQKFELRKAPADLKDILEKVERDFYPAADKKGLSISLELPAEPLRKIVIDRAQVERVLGNLVQNSINYTPGGGAITVKAGEAERDGKKYAVVTVSDTGRGIPKEEQDKVFSQYYRSARTAGIKGSGLGLTIARAVTEAHGGFIELESEPGKGSTFTVFLPI